MGTLESESLENSHEPPGDPLQEDALETSRSPDEVLALRTRVAQLEGDLPVAHARIQDLTEINSHLRLAALNPAPKRANENAEPPPPSELPVTGVFWPDGLAFTRPCKIFQAKVFKE